jgi:hypothetical protein
MRQERPFRKQAAISSVRLKAEVRERPAGLLLEVPASIDAVARRFDL